MFLFLCVYARACVCLRMCTTCVCSRYTSTILHQSISNLTHRLTSTLSWSWQGLFLHTPAKCVPQDISSRATLVEGDVTVKLRYIYYIIMLQSLQFFNSSDGAVVTMCATNSDVIVSIFENILFFS